MEGIGSPRCVSDGTVHQKIRFQALPVWDEQREQKLPLGKPLLQHRIRRFRLR